MATKEDQLVADIFALVTMMVEIVNPFAEALPLRLGTLRIKLVVCGVFPVYQPKVVLSLLMSAESVTAQDRGEGRVVRSRIRLDLSWDHLEESSLQPTCSGSACLLLQAMSPWCVMRGLARLGEKKASCSGWRDTTVYSVEGRFRVY